LKRFGLTVGLLLLICSPTSASTFDNEAGAYVLTALPDAESEARRMDRMQLCDQQPAGIAVRKGQRVSVTVQGLDSNDLAAMVGFRPLWGDELDQQEQLLVEGENRFTAEQDGPLFFRFIQPSGAKSLAEVTIKVSGGRPLPLYVDGSMSAEDWADELAAHADAPFVQLLGDQAMITLPSSLSDFQREMRCAAGRMDARRGAQPMALPLASVATQETPSRRAIRRTGRPFGALRSR